MGENKVTITASNGKVFHGTIDSYASLFKEFNAYESDLALQRAKLEAEKKEQQQKSDELFQQVQKNTKIFNDSIMEYLKNNGDPIGFVLDDGNLTVRKHTGFSNSYNESDKLAAYLCKLFE